jgi:hypothetical protein
LDIKDINNLSEEEEKDKYTSQNCWQTLAKVSNKAFISWLEKTQFTLICPQFQAIASKLKKSPSSRDLFADICEAHSIQSPHQIAQDVQTRWNSTFLQLTGVNWCQKAM